MKRSYKLIDRNLISRFGKIVVTLDETVGNRFIKAGKAISSTGSEQRKSLRTPPQHKAIFQPPEEKTFSELGDDKNIRYPGLNDKLFPHIAK